jgi:general secretion pathway protein A
MYWSSFGLAQDPFSIAPDPRFLFLSERHREALAHLLYGVKGGGGFVLLTGEIGAGKTTVCRCFLAQLPPDCDVAYVFNPKLSATELLHTVLEEFRLPRPAEDGLKACVDALNAFLLAGHAAGRHRLLIIDEAQNLSSEVLEQLRLLTNLETDTHKLLQIVLIGQPELRQRLAEPGLEQLAQRVIARYHLGPLDAAETAAYLAHRLAVAGLRGEMPLRNDALKALHRLSGGVPRRINLLAGRALLGAYAQGRHSVDAGLVRGAAHELFEDGAASARRGAPPRWTLGALAALGVAAALAWAGTRPVAPPASALTTAAPTPPPRLPVAAAALAVPAATQPRVEPLLDAAALAARLPAGGGGEESAWLALLEHWGAPREPSLSGEAAQPQEADRPVCARIRARGLACYQGQLTLAQIRQLDRPGWIRLRGVAQPATAVLLLGLDGDSALLQDAQGRLRVPLPALATLWQGDFATLWRLPAGGREPGASASTTNAELRDWLLAQLGRYQQDALPLDVDLPTRIAAFQRAQGLRADGRPGPLTLMQLNRAAAVAEPRLETR